VPDLRPLQRAQKSWLHEKDSILTTFAELGLAEPLLKALNEEGYTNPTPIQAKAIPPVMAGRDLLGIAQTGTGKTAAFALPILHRLAANRQPAPRRGCRVLVLSPTRELATPIADSFRTYGRHMGFTVAAVFGGVAHRPQTQALARGVDVLIATPGRLMDHMEQRTAALEGTEIFVLDEADQMLDLGFVKPIRRIVSHLAMRRQNLFFSATMPTEIAGLAGELLRDPERIAIAPVATTAERVNQRVIPVEASRKRSLLAELLASPEMSRTLVFTRTKRGADRVARHLETGGTKVAAIHGNKSQRQREAALEDFRNSKISVLVATDIAARGIDIDLVSHVVNFELPEVPEAYVHRIGRTARAGASGIAISLCDGAERDLLRAIERLTRQQIPSEDRRNDAGLAADKASAASSDDRRDDDRARGHRNGSGHRQASNGARRDGGAPRHNGHRPANGEARKDAPRHARPSHAHGEGRPSRDGDFRDGAQRARPNHHRADDRPSRSGDARKDTRPHGDRERPQRSEHAPRSAHRPNSPQRAHDGDKRKNEGSGDLSSVGFLAARPARPAGERRDHHEHRRDDRHGNRPLSGKPRSGPRQDTRPARDRGAH
jgi:ATP-dependent RNA helicase RhlE